MLGLIYALGYLMSMKLKNKLISILKKSDAVMAAVDLCHAYGLPNHYVAGGVVTQTIWNDLLNRPLTENIKDIDVVYYNANEPLAAQREHEKTLNMQMMGGVPLDLKNQAYVHQWYPEKFGKVIQTYQLTEDGIDSWLSAFAVGVRRVDQEYDIYAPYGLEDLFAMRICPNKKIMPQDSYEKMVKSFQERWPAVSIEDW